jgi:mono/diheme cytochrome c family protein
MTRSPRRLLSALALGATAAALAACGSHGVQLASSSPDYKGAEIFANHCSGCHTLSVAGTEGSAYNVRTREYKDGPNFNQRKEKTADVLYAIRNGGFSSGPMPQDIVTGSSAERVARFVAKYSGSQAGRSPEPGQPPVEGAQPSSTP